MTPTNVPAGRDQVRAGDVIDPAWARFEAPSVHTSAASVWLFHHSSPDGLAAAKPHAIPSHQAFAGAETAYALPQNDPFCSHDGLLAGPEAVACRDALVVGVISRRDVAASPDAAGEIAGAADPEAIGVATNPVHAAVGLALGIAAARTSARDRTWRDIVDASIIALHRRSAGASPSPQLARRIAPSSQVAREAVADVPAADELVGQAHAQYERRGEVVRLGSANAWFLSV